MIFSPENYFPDQDAVLIRCASHRAREKLIKQFSGLLLRGYYSWSTDCTGGFYPIPASRISEALAITGCSKASLRHSYRPCISFR